MLTPTGNKNYKHTINKKNKIIGTQFLKTQVRLKKRLQGLQIVLVMF
jgi:hypothetical protein